MVQPERPYARGVDDPAAAVGQRQGECRGGGVPAAPRDGVDHPGRPPPVLRHQRVDQGRLADPGVSDEGGDPVVQQLAHTVRGVTVLQLLATGHDVRDAERGVGLQELVRRGQVRLGQHQERAEPAVVRRDQAAVDHARAGLGIGERGDDGQLVGVGHDHPLEGVVVVRRAAQHRRTRTDPHDAGQGVLVAGEVPDERHPVAHHRCLAAEFAGLHGRHRAVVDEAGQPAPVDGEDHAVLGVLVLGPRVGAGPVALGVGADADVVLVGVLPVAAHVLRPRGFPRRRRARRVRRRRHRTVPRACRSTSPGSPAGSSRSCRRSRSRPPRPRGR